MDDVVQCCWCGEPVGVTVVYDDSEPYHVKCFMADRGLGVGFKVDIDYAKGAKDITRTLKDRGSKYNPDPKRRYKELSMWTAMAVALEDHLPHDLSPETLGAINAILLKTARAIEGGINGVYHHDNSVDFEGYSKVLVGTKLGIPPEDVTEDG